MASESGETERSPQTSYVFVRVLGRGAFGEAILYRKTDDNSLVVWKEVNLNILSDKARNDAQNEINILSMLNHANIVSYYNHFMDDHMLFIEMEYANGGSLQEKISNATELFPEQEVLWYMFQITCALNYVHQYDVIHRDIKALNIFLTKVGLLKLGDFGISKMLESKNQKANSVVGTPYYMSPELVKGEHYNFKSDIWALGCVLYEMLTLTRTFQATNPLKLAYEIVQADHESIDCQYSPDMQVLVNQMLRKDPNERPTAEEILHGPLFCDAGEMERKVWELNSTSRRLRLSTSTSSVMQPVVTSKMCEVYQWGGGKITPQKLEIFTKEKCPIQVAAGHHHFAAITIEKELYTWANPQGAVSICGQLGHGDTAAYKGPKRVDSLLGQPIHQVACGEDFTLCLSDEGVVYGFGSSYYGCVGSSGEEDVLLPQPVEFFLDHPVQQVSCGDNHVVVLTRYGDVYTWGAGDLGKLGLDSEDDFATPQKVDLPGKHLVKEAEAGSDGTFLICDSGKLLACGSNEFNKLGLNSETSGLRKRKEKTYDIPCISTFTTVKSLNHKTIIAVAAGKTHSATIDCYGQLYTFGSNRYGQLGLGDFRRHVSVKHVRGVLVGQRVVKVACGDSFTVVTTSDNMVFAFGLGENGRLGADFSDTGSGPGGQCMAIPRPIFGSMHIVPCLSSRQWNTLIIAEKVLNSKTLKTQDSRVSLSSPKVANRMTERDNRALMQTVLSSPVFEPPALSSHGEGESDYWSEVSVDNVDSDDRNPGDEAQTQQVERLNLPFSTKQTQGSSIPPWLEQELQDAEVIPLPYHQGSLNSSEPRQDSARSDEPEQWGRADTDVNNRMSVQEEDPKTHGDCRSLMDKLLDCSQEQLMAMLLDKEEEILSLQRTVNELRAENSKLRESMNAEYQ